MRTLIVFSLALVFSLAGHAADPFEIKDGDRVLLLGDTLLEREGTYGFLEARMHEQFPDRCFTVRNLAFSADTPLGWSRASFDPAAKGFERLKEQLDLVKPTVVFLGYGMAASLQEMTDRSGDPTLNPDPVRYGAEPMSAARFKRELGELMTAIEDGAKAYLTAEGAKDAEARGAEKNNPSADLSKTSAPSAVKTGPAVRFVLLSPIRHEDLRKARPGLPDPARHNQLLEQYSKAIAELATEREARFVHLQKHFSEDGWDQHQNGPKPLPTATDNGIHLNEQGWWAFKQYIAADLGWLPPSVPDEENEKRTSAKHQALRAAIVRKNELFFHRWRPANSTYLFGFRKHEQGQNAKEMPMFDPLIAEMDEVIDRLKKPDASAPSAESKPVAELKSVEPQPRPDFTVADGFKIELWAENPLLEKPTQMNWDSHGRLWVCSSGLYPQIEPGGMATDKVLILEDPEHTGKATKSTVFTSNLLIPTGVVPASTPEGHDACYVGQSTELLYFEDTDGDGKADKKRVVLSGFGTEDTHHIVHTLKWTPDGRLNFNQSIYIHTHAETPWGVVRVNSGGVLSWDPRTEKVEVFSKGLWNTWGHQFDKWGQSFQTDGAGSTGLTWSFPGSTFAPFEGTRRTLQSISPGSYPKFAGLELIYSPHFPADWQGNAITCDFRAHRIVRFGMTDLAQGEKPQAGYVTQELPDVVRTSDVSFRPIDVKLGPDGALYVADWSNPVINHGEVDFRDPRRDHTHGRIWRITKKDAMPVKWSPLAGRPNVELFEKMLSDSLWEREQARRVLVARGSSPDSDVSADPLVGITTGAMSISIGSLMWAEKRKDAEAALAANQLARGFEIGTPDELVTSKNDLVRAAAVRLLGDSVSHTLELLRLTPMKTDFFDPNTGREWVAKGREKIAALAADPHPRVRLEALRSLGRIPMPESAAVVLDAAIKTEGDPFLEYAAWLSINDLARPWTDAIASGAWKIDGREKQLEYGLNAIDPTLAGATLTRLFNDGKVQLTKGPWIELIGRAGGPSELTVLFDSLILSYAENCCPGRDLNKSKAIGLTEPEALRAIAALLEATRVRNAKPEGEIELAHLAPHAPEALRPGLARLAGYWKAKDAFDFLPALAQAGESKPALRFAAIEGLRAYGGKDALNFLDVLTRPDQPLDIRLAALVAITQIKLDAGIVRAADVLPAITDEKTALTTWRELLAVQRAADAFAVKFNDAQWTKALPKPVLVAGVRAAREVGRKGQALVQVLTPLAGVVAAPTALADYKSLAEQTKRNGDPAQGELIYRRVTSGCTTCHAIGGAGGIVGPALTSIGASAPMDYIIESLLAPNAKVKEGYNAVTLKLKDGTEVTGIQARETAQEVVLRNVAGQETPVPKANVTGKTDVGSIMPAGLLETLTDRERLNLYAFLGELGKPGPYDASKGAVARVWRLYPGSQPEKALKQDTADFPGLAYSLVDGRLQKNQLTDAMQLVPNPGDVIFATAQFQIANGGRITLNLTGISKAWLDGQALAIASEPNPSPELAPGVHTLAVKLDVKSFPEILRAEIPGANFLGN